MLVARATLEVLMGRWLALAMAVSLSGASLQPAYAASEGQQAKQARGQASFGKPAQNTIYQQARNALLARKTTAEARELLNDPPRFKAEMAKEVSRIRKFRQTASEYDRAEKVELQRLTNIMDGVTPRSDSVYDAVNKKIRTLGDKRRAARAALREQD
jgi:hypothetical protein